MNNRDIIVSTPGGVLIDALHPEEIAYLQGYNDALFQHNQWFTTHVVKTTMPLVQLMDIGDHLVRYASAAEVRVWLNDHYKLYAGNMAEQFRAWEKDRRDDEHTNGLRAMLQRRRVAWENGMNGDLTDLKTLAAEKHGDWLIRSAAVGRPPGLGYSRLMLVREIEKYQKRLKNSGQPNSRVEAAIALERELRSSGQTDNAVYLELAGFFENGWCKNRKGLQNKLRNDFRDVKRARG